MTDKPESVGTSTQPVLADLMARYLQSQTSAHETGLGFAMSTGEVTPYDAVPAQPVDPRLAWHETLIALRLFKPVVEADSAPVEWPALVAAQEPVSALALCVGNYPQLVRHLQPILQASDLTSLKSITGRAIVVPALLDWADQVARACRYPHLLFAIGSLRLARQFDKAAELLHGSRASVPAEWKPAWDNEEAALAWHRGLTDQALARWQTQAASVPVLFNVGMAQLFLGKPASARAPLSNAVEQLPEMSAWHHLGRLYLTLAEMRD